ncbi:MAG: SCO family protein [Bacteroidota bacterium]
MKISSGGWKVIAFAAVFAVGVGFAYRALNKEEKVPIYEPGDINPRLVDSSVIRTNTPHHVSDFSLLDQNGDTVTLKNVAGKIYVADFFFTTCGSICPKMTASMSRISEAFKDDPRIMLVSHTVDPETDNVDVLHKYAQEHGADAKQWLILTGDKKQIYELARKSYFAVLDEPSTEGPDFIHTENLVLVDEKGRLRGFCDGTDKKQVDNLIEDIRKLLEDYGN